MSSSVDNKDYCIKVQHKEFKNEQWYIRILETGNGDVVFTDDVIMAFWTNKEIAEVFTRCLRGGDNSYEFKVVKVDDE